MKVLGIESSCDETAAAIVEDGKKIISNVVATQIPFHQIYKGVVPEIAGRKHAEWILPVVNQALTEANMDLSEVDAICATNRPGLMGSLLVGLTFGKTLAWATGKPFVAVNHMLGHLYAAHLENDIPYPYLGLLVSGGHSIICKVKALAFRIPFSLARNIIVENFLCSFITPFTFRIEAFLNFFFCFDTPPYRKENDSHYFIAVLIPPLADCVNFGFFSIHSLNYF